MHPNMAKLVEKELSYKIMGVLFDVHSKLGGRYQEKYYQRAVEEGLKKAGLSYKKEIQTDLLYNDKKIGKYTLDFLIDNKVVLELKAVPRLRLNDFKQLVAYLKATNLEIGILANFSGDKLYYKRILNPLLKNSG